MSLALGSRAPDFHLARLDPARGLGPPVRLADLMGEKPVVLVFGSLTCPVTRSALPAIDDLQRRYGDRATFLFVYVREAHPSDEGPTTQVAGAIRANREAGIDLADPRTPADRAAAARRLAELVGTEVVAAVDGLDDAVARAYGAWPFRVYVVGRDGLIRYRSPNLLGEFGVDDLERALAAEVDAIR